MQYTAQPRNVVISEGGYNGPDLNPTEDRRKTTSFCSALTFLWEGVNDKNSVM